jgi:N-acetylglucosaminyl-diphospho-decaprenol L-rhamnosyltransferase
MTRASQANPSCAQHCAKLIVIIVSYGNFSDVERCLYSLGRSDWTDLDIFVCENAGQAAFARLQRILTQRNGPLELVGGVAEPLDRAGGRLAEVSRCCFRGSSVTVRLAVPIENLGYAGGINAWLERLLACPGWDAALILNPDTTVSETALTALMAKATEGFGMVGATLVYDDHPDRITNYGIHWSRRTGRRIGLGMNAFANGPPSDQMVAKIDAISGACVLVTRAFINDVGLMAEDYFLYSEDLDWGIRRGAHRIGLAAGALVRHIGGTSIGDAWRSPLSAYLSSRNLVLFSRRWAGRRWPVHFAVGLLYLVKPFCFGSARIAWVAFVGLIDGARGKRGRPDMSRYHAIARVKAASSSETSTAP